MLEVLWRQWPFLTLFNSVNNNIKKNLTKALCLLSIKLKTRTKKREIVHILLKKSKHFSRYISKSDAELGYKGRSLMGRNVWKWKCIQIAKIRKCNPHNTEIIPLPDLCKSWKKELHVWGPYAWRILNTVIEAGFWGVFCLSKCDLVVYMKVIKWPGKMKR